MKRYWLSQRGQTTGPFAGRVLLEMWEHGSIDAQAQVCEEGTEDWMQARFVVNELEQQREREGKTAGVQPLPEPVKQPSVLRRPLSGASTCFIAAMILGGLLLLVVQDGGKEMVFAALLGGLVILLGVIMLAQGAFVRGLLTILFILLLGMGVVSRMRHEATIEESRRFDQQMDRLLTR